MLSALGEVTGFRLWFSGPVERWTAVAFMMLPLSIVMLALAVMQIVMQKYTRMFFGSHNPMPAVLFDALSGAVGIASLFTVFLSLNNEHQKSVFQNDSVTLQSVIAVFALLAVLVWILLTFAASKIRFIGGFAAAGFYLILAVTIGVDMIDRLVFMLSRNLPLRGMSVTGAPIVMLFVGVVIAGLAIAQMIVVKRKPKPQPAAPGNL